MFCIPVGPRLSHPGTRMKHMLLALWGNKVLCCVFDYVNVAGQQVALDIGQDLRTSTVIDIYLGSGNYFMGPDTP
jgi:hypothetical protein